MKEEKSFNLVVIDTKQEVLNVLNESQLPITVIHMMIGELLSNITMQMNSVLIEENKKAKTEVK